MNLGKIVRLHDDGTVPDDNPFADRGGVTAEIWSLGHRNPLGLAFDSEGRLWNQEMGPRHGDDDLHCTFSQPVARAAVALGRWFQNCLTVCQPRAASRLRISSFETVPLTCWPVCN